MGQVLHGSARTTEAVRRAIGPLCPATVLHVLETGRFPADMRLVSGQIRSYHFNQINGS